MINKQIDKPIMLTNEQLERQLKTQVEFLKKVWPWTLESGFQDAAGEVRPLKRTAETKYMRSFKAWRFAEKDIDEFKKFLGTVNGKAYCLYYSIFGFVYELETNSKEKGKINKENAKFTCCLAMDFDNISNDDFELEKKKLTNLGIETIDIYSGHGFQSIILLKEKIYDKDILNKFTNLLISKGLKVDPSIIDCARIMRLPNSFNNKALNSKSKYFGTGVIPTSIVNDTDKRYSVKDILKKINSLKTTAIEDKLELNLELVHIEKLSIVKEDKIECEKVEKKNIRIQNVKSLYDKYLYIERLPEPVQLMLKGVREGFRNKVLLFLVPFLRNTLGLNIQTIKNILVIWGNLNEPSWDKEFIYEEVDRLYRYNFRGKQGTYTKELVKEYGYLEFSEFRREHKIIIPNDIFEDYDIISDSAVKLYLAIKLFTLQEDIVEVTKVDIQRAANVAERTVERNMIDLINRGYVCKKRANRRVGEAYIYYINPYFNKTKGFTMIENAAIKLILKELNEGEIKLYTYLCKMIADGDTECWASQKFLARKIGKKSTSTISKITDNLVCKKYIEKSTENDNGILHCTYRLIY